MHQTQAPYDEFAQAETLRAVGLTNDQAREIVRVAASIKTEHLATKADIERNNTKMETVRTELKEDIANVRTELKEDIAETKEQLTKVEAGLNSRIDAVRISCFKMILGALSVQTGLLAIIMSILKFWH